MMMAESLLYLGRSEEALGVLTGLVDACIRLEGETSDETLRARIWLAKACINLGDYRSAHDELKAILQAYKQTGRWWDPEAEARTKEYWRIVSPEEIPD
jgi:Tetratricopeptide repeat